jgi:hypothetical protein
MSLLDSPRCPQCHSAIELAELSRALKICRVRTDRVGVVCPVCRAKLQVLRDLKLSGVVALLLVVPLGVMVAHAVPLGLSWRRENAIWLVTGLIALGGFAVEQSVARGVLRLRLLKEEEKAAFPLMAPTKEHDRQSPEEAEEQSAWTCPKCGEDNPETFDQCWKCEAERLVVEGSSSTQ